MAQGLVGDRGLEWVDGREQGWVDGKGLESGDGKGLEWEDGRGQLVGGRVLGLLVGGREQVGDRVREQGGGVQGKLVPGGSLP